MLYQYCPKCGQQYPDQQQQKYTLICTKCDFVFFIDSKPTANAIIVDAKKILLGKRRCEPNKGMWGVIGGFLHHGEHPVDGVKREVKEETGLDIEIKDLLGFFMDTYGRSGNATLNICFVAKATSLQVTPGDDVEEVQWFLSEDLPKEIAFKADKDMIDAWIRRALLGRFL